MQRILMILGVLFILVGLAWPWLTKLNLGQLPGDIAIKRENFSFYFPITTSILTSIIISLIFWLFRR
ncbi:DUF2905 domain-containing protein [Candidatus Nitrosacidococcus sp. I8]|uniref:DUF2905 domain-containing protein n=1 Tax=Candidatus Nitrosacidococcus sp. I8 TaxID=2942908 RepID=UPI002226957A|nr:DUF2905 domain-containing protein [Candidatus Nitrosacidococcus sp. I8]CAH9014660.1 hypothetical protein NURINAE_00089 [Candidatus Nitrosacidococcus sp. I8]